MAGSSVLRNTALMLVLMSFVSLCYGAYDGSSLKKGYYDGKCIQKSRFLGIFSRRPVLIDVEKTVSNIVWRKFRADKTVTPALLRMQFHDCFVKGCDASILLDGSNTEKTSPPNQSVREYDLIDHIKETLESLCPGVVSCADIIAMATRDAVYFASSDYPFSRYPRLSYPPKSYGVENGRKDGLVSVASNAFELPRPTASAAESIAAFDKKGLDAEDLTYLLGGGHSVGVTHCVLIQDRLSNFSGSGKPDESMNTNMRISLAKYCANNPGRPVSLDQGTPNTVDASLYKQVTKFQRGILKADQDLASHSQTRPVVDAILRGSKREFNANFWRAMVRMQGLREQGAEGEIRRTCRAVNRK